VLQCVMIVNHAAMLRHMRNDYGHQRIGTD
jgi:hypothetical protein